MNWISFLTGAGATVVAELVIFVLLATFWTGRP